MNIYDVDQDGARVFVVMEWFPHGSLARVLAHTCVPLPAVLELDTLTAALHWRYLGWRPNAGTCALSHLWRTA